VLYNIGYLKCLGRGLWSFVLVQCATAAAQLDNIEDTLGMMNYEMHNAEEELENLEKCCGLCVLPWDRYVCRAVSAGLTHKRTKRTLRARSCKGHQEKLVENKLSNYAFQRVQI